MREMDPCGSLWVVMPSWYAWVSVYYKETQATVGMCVCVSLCSPGLAETHGDPTQATFEQGVVIP